MLCAFHGAWAVIRIDCEHLSDQIAAALAAVLGLPVGSLFDLPVYFGLRVSVEGELAGHQHVEHHAEGPDVALLLVVSVNDLWGHEVRSAGHHVHRRLRFLGQTKVHQEDVVVLIEEDVFRLDVTVDNVFGVAVGQGG